MNDFIRHYKLPLLTLGAVFTGLTLVMPEAGFIEWISLIPVFSVLLCLTDGKNGNVKYKKTYGYGLLFFTAFYIVNYHWFIAMYPLDFLGVGKGEAVVLVIACWLALSLFQAVAAAVIFPLFKLLSKCSVFTKMPVLKVLLFSLLWTVFEWTQSLTWAGVPWCRLCLGQIKFLPILGSVSLFGSYFVTFVILAVNGFLAYMLLYADKIKLCSVCAAGLFAFNLVAGIIVDATSRDDGPAVKVAGLQGNVSSKDRWDEGQLGVSYDAYTKLTKEAADEGAELIIWPETAIPTVFTENGRFKATCSKLASDNDITLFAGISYRENGKRNSLMQFYPDGTKSPTVYSKRHLVPFGEYLPGGDFVRKVFPFAATLLADEEEYVPGESTALFDCQNGQIGSIICFESIYEQMTLDSVRDGAGLIIMATNDSWFSDSAAAYMHTSQAQLRAIETGRYIVRAANTGYSVIISPTGKIIADEETEVEGYVIGDVYFRYEKTLYSVIGNLFVYLCIAALVLCPVVDIFSKNRLQKKQSV